MRTQTVLSNDELKAIAPSIFANEPWHAMSDRYTFIPTSVIVDRMRNEGFVPVKRNQYSKTSRKQSVTTAAKNWRNANALGWAVRRLAQTKTQRFPWRRISESKVSGLHVCLLQPLRSGAQK